MCEADSLTSSRGFSFWPTSTPEHEWRMKSKCRTDCNAERGWGRVQRNAMRGRHHLVVTHIKPAIIHLPYSLPKWSVIYHFSNFSEYNGFWHGLHLTFKGSAFEVIMVTRSNFLNINMDIHIDVGVGIVKWRKCSCPSEMIYLKIFLNMQFYWSYVWQWDKGGGRNEKSYLDPSVVSYSLLLRAQEILTWNVYHFSQYANLSHKLWSRRNRTLLFFNSSWFLLWNLLLPSW